MASRQAGGSVLSCTLPCIALVLGLIYNMARVSDFGTSLLMIELGAPIYRLEAIPKTVFVVKNSEVPRNI